MRVLPHNLLDGDGEQDSPKQASEICGVRTEHEEPGVRDELCTCQQGERVSVLTQTFAPAKRFKHTKRRKEADKAYDLCRTHFT